MKMLISFGMSGSDNKGNNGKKRLRKRVAIMLLLLIPQVLFLLYSPKFFTGKVDSDPYSEWMQFEREAPVSVIKVWHIVGFKPFVGSLGNWLKETAKAYAADRFGVYIDVSSFTPEEAAEQLARGLVPDVISFSDECPIELLQCLGAEDGTIMLCSLPYCASGKVLVYDPEKADPSQPDEAICGTADEFKSGKAACCECDIRGAGDLLRAQLIGKCPYFEVEPIGADAKLVQRIGVSKGIDAAKIPYALGFIDAVLSESRQTALVSIGLIPAVSGVESDYEYEWLDRLNELVTESGVLSVIGDR